MGARGGHTAHLILQGALPVQLLGKVEGTGWRKSVSHARCRHEKLAGDGLRSHRYHPPELRAQTGPDNVARNHIGQPAPLHRNCFTVYKLTGSVDILYSGERNYLPHPTAPQRQLTRVILVRDCEG